MCDKPNVLFLEKVMEGSGIQLGSRWKVLGCSAGKARIVSSEGTESAHVFNEVEFSLVIDDADWAFFGPEDLVLLRRTNCPGKSGEDESEFQYFICSRFGEELECASSVPHMDRTIRCWGFKGSTGEIAKSGIGGERVYILHPDDPGYLDALVNNWTWQQHYSFIVEATGLKEELGDAPQDAVAARKLVSLAIKYHERQQRTAGLGERHDRALSALCEMLRMEDDHLLYAMWGDKGIERLHALQLAGGIWQAIEHLASEAELQDLRQSRRRFLQPKQPEK